MHQKSLTELATPDLPSAILERLPIAQEVAQKNVLWLEQRHGPALQQIHREVSTVASAKVSPQNRIRRLRFLAGQWSALTSSAGACRAKCTHCCHIGVVVPQEEAELIAKAIGVATSPHAQTYGIHDAKDAGGEFFGKPCTFLTDKGCSIYEHRPLVCRTLVNMDADDLLCQLVPGSAIPVPYASSIFLQGLFALLTQTQRFADIRQWFPSREPPLNNCASKG